MRFHTVMFKTLDDLFRIKRSLLFIIAVLIVPIIISGLLNSVLGLSTMSLANQIQTVTMFYIIIVFFWVAGIPLVLLAGVTCGDFISKEENEGTLLLLVSKPVGRHEIVLGKYFAFLINILILEIIAVTLSALIMYWILPIDPAVLDSMTGLIPAIIFYAMFIAVTFGALATALSCIFKSRFKTIMILVVITMAVFLGFMAFRGFMSDAGIYDPYIVWADVNYHMGNSYLSFIDSTGYRMAPTLQATLGMFTGTYSAADPSMLFDVDIGAMYPSIPRNDYVSPLLSLFGWFIFTIALLVFGIMRFQRREIK